MGEDFPKKRTKAGKREPAGMEITATSATSPKRERELVVGSYIDVVSRDSAVERIMGWAERRQSRTVDVCNVHSVVTAKSDPVLAEAINRADMATPDGMPIAWFIRWKRGNRQERISGMELTLALCQEAEARGVIVAFYGSRHNTLEKLRESLVARFPNLVIGTMIAPPFRSLSNEELAADLDALNRSGAGIIFVGLGCPKQEIWMHANRERLYAVQVGIGAAFDFIAGIIRRPPVWMRESGLEWLGRLLMEPRRLWRRYLITNTKFLIWYCTYMLSGRRRER